MMSYVEVIESFPEELRVPLARLVDALRAELGVHRTDFEDLRAIVRELAQAQKRTEERVEELAQAQKRTEERVEELAQAQKRTEERVEELAQAQKRTEERVEELAQAQKRTEERVEELAQAQKRTEERVEELAQAQKRTEERVEELAQAQKRTEERVEELAQAQKRTEERVEELAQAQKRTEVSVASLVEIQKTFERTFLSQMGALGARWGLQTEEAFRTAMRSILADLGFRTERFVAQDGSGEVFGHPEQIELDVVVHDGQTLVIEIKSAVGKGDVYLFDRKVRFYTQRTNRPVQRKLMVTPFVESGAREVAARLGVELCSDINALG